MAWCDPDGPCWEAWTETATSGPLVGRRVTTVAKVCDHDDPPHAGGKEGEVLDVQAAGDLPGDGDAHARGAVAPAVDRGGGDQGAPAPGWPWRDPDPEPEPAWDFSWAKHR